MAVCFFDKEYDSNHKYKCDYEVMADEIVVTVDYDITKEVEAVNGVKAIGPNIIYANRDILIVDHNNGINYLLKDAYYNGSSAVYGSPDGGMKTKFVSSVYFSSNSFQSLAGLKEMPKVSSITIVSKDLLRYLSESSINRTEYEDKLVITLNREVEGEKRHIGTNNIKEISLQDYWYGGFNKRHDIVFDTTGHLLLKLARRVNYTDVSKYVYEVYVFLQIYTKRSLKVDEIQVSVDGITFGISFYMGHFGKVARKNTGEKSVSDSMMSFLERCYSTIPYRNSKSDIRNIPYIIIKRDRSIEDSFLMYYRFVECYYKRQRIPKISNSFITYSLAENYMSRGKVLLTDIEHVANEIVSLRNRYVHSGYYIRNESLRIKFDDSSKNYTAKADLNWIFERTRILYDCAVDIIFTDMLKYEKYSFTDM